MTDLELLEELKKIDTPTVTNVVATYPGRPYCLELYNPWTENWRAFFRDQRLLYMGRQALEAGRLPAGTFAALDSGPAPEQVEAFAAALRAAGIENDLHIYDEVNHGFWLRVDGAPEVRTGPALDAWQRLKAYFARTIGTSSAPE